MNKLFIFGLITLTVLTYATGQSGNSNGKGTDNKNENGKTKFFNKCALEKCSKEVSALKALKHAPKELDECHKNCHKEHNLSNKKYKELDKEQVKKLKACLVKNKCIKDKEARLNFRNSKEFKNFKSCYDQNCQGNKSGATTPTSAN